mgnify:CR=1 FL=1
MEQRSDEWFAARRGRLTGSMVGAALGLAPYQSKDDCLRALVRDMHGMPSEFEGNIATEYGTNHEDMARRAYEMETGNDVLPASFVPFETWSGASPDGYVGDDGLLEIKCPFGKRKDDPPEFDKAEDQPHYYAQMQVQMHFTGRNWCDFFQWAAKGHALERVPYDPVWIAENMPKLQAFWWKAKDADPADFEGPKRKVIDTPDAAKLVAEYDELSDAIDNATQRKKDIIAQLVQAAGEKDALVAGRNLTLVRRKGSVSYAKALAKIAPDADLEPFRGKASESWQLR